MQLDRAIVTRAFKRQLLLINGDSKNAVPGSCVPAPAPTTEHKGNGGLRLDLDQIKTSHDHVYVMIVCIIEAQTDRLNPRFEQRVQNRLHVTLMMN